MAQKQLNSFELPKWNTERRRTPRTSPFSSTRPVPECAHVEFELTKDELEALEALEELQSMDTPLIEYYRQYRNSRKSCPSEHQLVDVGVNAEEVKKVVAKGKAKVENKSTGKKTNDGTGEVVTNKESLVIKLPHKKVMHEEKANGKQERINDENKGGKEAKRVGSGNGEGTRTWNLRSRTKQSLLNANMGGNVDDMTDIMKRINFDLCLTPREIEEDLRRMNPLTSRRIKKRPKNLQNKLDNLFPGNNLSNITAETYNVPESRKKHG